MLGDFYGTGAIVMGYSFKKHNKDIETIVMITRDVSDKLRKKLEEIYDRVILINYTFCSTKMNVKRVADRYVGWINYSFTKWKCLLFEEYDRILFIDSDLLILDDIKEIFDFKPPAGIFFNHVGKNKLNPNGTLVDSYYPLNADSKNTITKKMIISGYKENDSSFVLDASYVLLKPTKKKYKKMMKLLSKNYYMYPENVKSGPDEFILTEIFDNWTTISPSYNYSWKYNEIFPNMIKKGMNFRGIEKPWEVDKNKYEDMKIWWKYADELKDIKNYIVPKKYIDESVIYFYDKNKKFDFDKEKWRKLGYVTTLISFEKKLPHEIYDKFNVVCKLSKVNEERSAFLLTQFKKVYLVEYNMKKIEPDLKKYIN